MATAVHLDTLTTLTCVEEHGAITSMTREALVSGLESATDYGVLNDALDAVGVPAAGSVPTGMENLVLAKRSPSLVPGKKGIVRVGLEYIAQGQSEAEFSFRFSGSLSQIQTETSNGAPIELKHTWPDDDPDWPGEEHTQGGVLNVLAPQMEAIATGIIETAHATPIIHRWEGSLNKTGWAGGHAYRWLCTAVEAVPFDVSCSPKKWMFTFQFQHKSDGWMPTCWFVDPRTGRPPYGLVDGTGVRTIAWHPTMEFNSRFPQ